MRTRLERRGDGFEGLRRRALQAPLQLGHVGVRQPRAIPLRNDRHRAPAAAYATEKGVAFDADLDGLTVGDVESAAGSARLFANIVADKKRGATR